MSMMEHLPGNILIFPNEVQLGKGGAQFLLFLKQKIQERFHNQKKSRLKNAVVEILHKETIAEQKNDTMTRLLHERISKINTTLLSKRDDIVLIGSTEISEGLTINEIRQVHILDPWWNISRIEQVIGRAIRIGNHKKHKDIAYHNVTVCMHITVPKKPFYTEDHNLMLLSKNILSPMERKIGDLHRFRFMYEKIYNIKETIQLVQYASIDAVYQNILHQQQICKLTPTWSIIYHYEPNPRLQDIVKVLLSTLSTTPVNSPIHTFTNEVDFLQQEIIEVFRHSKQPILTIDEILTRCNAFGTFRKLSACKDSIHIELDPSYYAHFLQDSTTISSHTDLSVDNIMEIKLSDKLQKQRLLSALLCQFKWHIIPSTISEDYISLTIDKAYLMRCSDFHHTQSDISTSNFTKWCSGLSNKMKNILNILLYKYNILVKPVSRNLYNVPTNRTIQKNIIFGVRVKHIRETSLHEAIQRMITRQDVIEYKPKCFYILQSNYPFYYLQRLNIPFVNGFYEATNPQFYIHENHIPFSVLINQKEQFTHHKQHELLRFMVSMHKQLIQLIRPLLITQMDDREIQQIIMEFIFDNLDLKIQDNLLHSLCVFNESNLQDSLDSLSTDIFYKSIQHRFIFKGTKQSECNPNDAKHLLINVFPMHAGKLMVYFPHNPATEKMNVKAYVKHAKQYAPFTMNQVYSQAVSFFSPIPINYSVDKQSFVSSKLVHNASQERLPSHTSIFMYNEVLNYKNKNARRYVQRVCALPDLIDVPFEDPKILTLLSEYHTQEPFYNNNLQEITLYLRNKITNEQESGLLSNIDVFLMVCYIWLRSKKKYIRYFFPGIIAKHPNRELYAGYRKEGTRKQI